MASSRTLNNQNFIKDCTQELRNVNVKELIIQRVEFDDKNMALLLDNLPLNVETLTISFCKMTNSAFNVLLQRLHSNTTVKYLTIERWQSPPASLATTINKKVLEFLDHNTTIEKIEIDGLNTVAVEKKIKARTSKLSSSSTIIEKKSSSTTSSAIGATNSHPVVESKAPMYDVALKFVLENNSSLNLINQVSGESLAHIACTASNLSLLKMMHSCGHVKPLLDSEDKEGNTPLSIALTTRNDELINYLLHIGATNIGCFPLIALLKHTRKDSLEWTVATKCGLGRWTVDQFEEVYSLITDTELRLRLLTYSVLRPLSSNQSQSIALLALKSYFMTRNDAFKTVFDVVELSHELRSRIFVQTLIDIVQQTSDNTLLELQSFVVSHFPTVDLPGVRDYYNSDNSTERTAKLKSFVLLCGTTHFQSLMISCRATMRAAIDWFESSISNSHLLPLLLGPITDFPKFDTSSQAEGGTAMVYGVEGRRDLVCKRTALYKSFVHEAIAMKIYSKSAHLMTYVSLHWDEQKTLFGITMHRMETDLQTELARAQVGKPLTDVHEIVVSIVKGMIDMHRTGFAHLDIKPGNVLISKQPNLVVKISDFGTAHLDSDSRDKLFTVVPGYTPSYAPPEVLDGKVTREHIQQADAYSFGRLLEKVLKYCPNQVMTTIMMRCLNAEYSERPAFDEILRLLNQAQM